MTKEYYHIGLSQNGIDTVHNIEIIIPHDFTLTKIIMHKTMAFGIKLLFEKNQLNINGSAMLNHGIIHIILYKPILLEKNTLIIANITNLQKEKQDFRATLFGTVERND